MLTSAEIRGMISIAYCSDVTYETPTREYIESVFKSYRTLMTWLRVFRWKAHHDCDDKAAGFRWLCGVKWGRKAARPAQGIAVGEIHYKIDNGGYHAINVVLLDDGSQAFVEPQGPKWIELSESEQKSIYFVRF